ncbi:hypothetical protein PR048_005972 [Dryococelus australis]|uniref:Reverse transcriptase domain-containing protein n=1 Tax=Dryococelus australis TaxID=614101 RepID=A0ABQ9I9Q6_9NEOP|nr:hypothetical protein PR048_005972 [Dryococelus australis]
MYIYLVAHYLWQHKFHVVLDGSTSTIRELWADVTQDSPLPPFFYNFYTAGIPHADTQLTTLERWCTHWRIKINAAKSTNLIINKKLTQPDRKLKILNTNISNIKTVKYLGITLDSLLTRAEHIKRITSIATGNLISLYPMLKASHLPSRKKLRVFKQIIRQLMVAVSGSDRHS